MSESTCREEAIQNRIVVHRLGVDPWEHAIDALNRSCYVQCAKIIDKVTAVAQEIGGGIAQVMDVPEGWDVRSKTEDATGVKIEYKIGGQS